MVTILLKSTGGLVLGAAAPSLMIFPPPLTPPVYIPASTKEVLHSEPVIGDSSISVSFPALLL